MANAVDTAEVKISQTVDETEYLRALVASVENRESIFDCKEMPDLFSQRSETEPLSELLPLSEQLLFALNTNRILVKALATIYSVDPKIWTIDHQHDALAIVQLQTALEKDLARWYRTSVMHITKKATKLILRGDIEGGINAANNIVRLVLEKSMAELVRVGHLKCVLPLSQKLVFFTWWQALQITTKLRAASFNLRIMLSIYKEHLANHLPAASRDKATKA
ncbi:hypothetical protein EJ08DRAFT_13394 [Tothia fuscella]|uniref:Uncharacterized protein n=1 Tax=Tothia fuscella TaxID=1048955 RepID=A0A9P4P2J6_9PEZI|nr:hypothetical protein EJ08DRAFT_13394 [Tothia fuscella]